MFNETRQWLKLGFYLRSARSQGLVIIFETFSNAFSCPHSLVDPLPGTEARREYPRVGEAIGAGSGTVGRAECGAGGAYQGAGGRGAAAAVGECAAGGA